MNPRQFAFLIIGLCLGALIDRGLNNRLWRNEAVKHGKAEYYLNEQNEREWRWKPEEK